MPLKNTAPDTNPEFEMLLEYLKRNRAFDFTGYKRSSLMRRVDKRMQMLEITDYSLYIDYLEVHPDEFAQLFNTILINVTGFYRDPHAWEFLAQEVIPRILQVKQHEETIRIWSAGCASGEEAYTLAMVLADALGPEAFSSRVKIYATDIDEEALSHARLACYNIREVMGVPQEKMDRYFERSGNRYCFHKELRRAVIFGRHDLIQDAPISRIDLLVCRNALMYFNAEVQTKILNRLHFALNDSGYLFLGKAELLFTHSTLFSPFDLKRRIFTKVPRGHLRSRSVLAMDADPGAEDPVMTNLARMQDLIFDQGPVAQVGVDIQGVVALANERARSLFRLTQRDVGCPLQDLELSYRPVELRSLIEQAYRERRTVTVKEAPWPQSGLEIAYLDVQVQPLQDAEGMALGANILFQDVTRYRQLQQELIESNRELETAYEEIQSTNEELETTNEELQSTVEELETTNEELQSTNEELETMNEELHSTNEELQTINDDLRQRSAELNQINAYFHSILASLQGGVIVLNRDLEIQVWNYKAEDYWGLRNDEVIGKNILNLDIGLPVDALKPALRACLSDHAQPRIETVSARNRRGRTILCRISYSPLIGANLETHGVILLMEEIVDA